MNLSFWCRVGVGRGPIHLGIKILKRWNEKSRVLCHANDFLGATGRFAVRSSSCFALHHRLCPALVPSSHQGLRGCGEAQRERPSDQGGAGQSTAAPQTVAEERLLQDPGSEEVGGGGGGGGEEGSRTGFNLVFTLAKMANCLPVDVSACIYQRWRPLWTAAGPKNTIQNSAFKPIKAPSVLHGVLV